MRQAGEIIPVSVEQSATVNNDEAKYGAGNAIDLDLDTYSKTESGSDGTTWLKVNLDKVYCVQHVMRYINDGTPYQTWTCTDTDCSNCVTGNSLTVSTEGAVSDLSPVSDCKYGDSVKLEKVDGVIRVYEIAIVGKPGKLPFIKIYTLHIQHNGVCTLVYVLCHRFFGHLAEVKDLSLLITGKPFNR